MTSSGTGGGAGFNAGFVIEPPVRDWHCPACGRTHRSREHRPHTPMHPCPKAGGLQSPMIEGEYRRGGIVQVEWQDYEGASVRAQRTDEGRAISNTVIYDHTGREHRVFRGAMGLTRLRDIT